MGYRFGIFNYATQNVGGFADFDYFKMEDTISQSNNDLLLTHTIH